MQVFYRMRRWRVPGIVVLTVLCLLSLSPAFAAPARDGEVSPSAQARTARVSASVTGAPLILSVEEGDVISNDPAAVASVVASGANWVRVLVHWSSIEAVEGTYNFASSDASINSLIAAGLSPIGVLVDNPSWAASTACGPVLDSTKVTRLASLMGALAARYPSVKIWSLYNEIDSAVILGGSGCFGSFDTSGGINHNGIPDYEEYAKELAAVRQAVLAANPGTVQEPTRVAMGALAMDHFSAGPDGKQCPAKYPGGCSGGLFNNNFASLLFTYMKNHPLPNSAPYMDMALFNYYDIYGRYWETVAKGHGLQSKTTAFRNRMTAAGLAVVPLGVSETGVRSNADYIGAIGQARCVNINLVRGMAAKLKFINWWTFKDYPDSAPSPQNTWKYGLVNQNLQPKDSYYAFSRLTSELNGYEFSKILSGKTGFVGVEAYFFKSGAAKKYVVWSMSIRRSSDFPECSWARNNSLATFTATKLLVVDYKGKTITVKDNSKKDKNPAVGKIAISVGNDPKFVQVNP